MLEHIKKFLGLDKISQALTVLEEKQAILNSSISYYDKKIEEYDRLTHADIDVSFRGKCTVVLTGVFQNKGYVQFYDIDHKEFEYLVRDFKERKKHGHVRNIDAPPSFNGHFDW